VRATTTTSQSCACKLLQLLSPPFLNEEIKSKQRFGWSQILIMEIFTDDLPGCGLIKTTKPLQNNG
jgi:hypothetical protein